METDVTGDAPERQAEFDTVVAWALQVAGRRAATDRGPFSMVLLARIEEGALCDETEVGLAPERRSAHLLDGLARSMLDAGSADFAVVVRRDNDSTMDIHVRSDWHELIVAARPDERGDYRAVGSSIVRRRRLGASDERFRRGFKLR